MEELGERDIEGHITLGDDIADKQQWSKSETTHAPSKNMTDSNLEAVKQLLLPEIVEENNNLKEEIQQQDAPIRQRPLAKVPIYQLLKWIFHKMVITLFLNLTAKVLHFSHLPKLNRQNNDIFK